MMRTPKYHAYVYEVFGRYSRLRRRRAAFSMPCARAAGAITEPGPNSFACFSFLGSSSSLKRAFFGGLPLPLACHNLSAHLRVLTPVLLHRPSAESDLRPRGVAIKRKSGKVCFSAENP